MDKPEEQLFVRMRNRPDIDGLRAIAVLLVVLYHAGFGFPGGFLGVDVFFVISGYLITGLLLQELAGGRISLGQFWLRRIRRILPASTALLLSVLLLGTCLLLPADLLELAASARAHLLFSANIFFWTNTGYFDGSVDLKPLLHFWSLAVEEQFYLLYPLYLIWFPPTRRSGKLLFSESFCSVWQSAATAISDTPVLLSTCCPAGPGSCCWEDCCGCCRRPPQGSQRSPADPELVLSGWLPSSCPVSFRRPTGAAGFHLG